MSDGSALFGPLAEDYARYRPGYPAAVLDELARACGLTSDWSVADVGSGTGNLARLFLAAGHKVYGIEPNREMRQAGERLLAGYPSFHSLDGCAEAIPLDGQSVELVAIGQALHWFEVDPAKAEFQRVLRPGGWVAVTWNDRLSDTTAFTREYGQITRALAREHASPCNALPLSAGLERLFGACAPHSASFAHTQSFDLDGFLGRARSSGYVPQPGSPNHDEAAALMTDLFTRHQRAGTVDFHYIARLFVAQLDPLP